MKFVNKIILVLSFVIASASANADLYSVPKVTTVQNRLYYLNNELTFQFSYLPLDPFVKYLALGGSYTKHFSNFTAWETINASYVFPIPAALKSNLNEIGKEGSTPSNIITFDDVFYTMNYYASTNLKFTPLYTKNLLFNSKIVYSLMSFVGGVGVASFQRDDKKETRFRPFINLGIVLHYMLSPNSLIKFDFRDQVFTNADTRNNLTLTFGYAFNFGEAQARREREIEDEF